MVLSNAERQARYRHRIQQLAARGIMTPHQAQMLAEIRRHLREWRRSVAAFGEGRMKLTTDHIDTTTEHVSMLQKMISTNEKLLSQYDPDDLTADGNVEISDVTSRESTGMMPGRWVSYALDDKGRGLGLRLFDAESLARADARRTGRNVGVIGQDMWSIVAEPTPKAYALVQKTGSGWWKALIPGLPMVDEEYALSRDMAINEISKAAQNALMDAVESGVRLSCPDLIRVDGWESVPIYIDIEAGFRLNSYC